MTVKAILSRKGNDVVTIKPTDRICDAVRILDKHRIGAVVITDASRFSAFSQNGILCTHLPTTSGSRAVVNFATSQSKRDDTRGCDLQTK